MKVERIQSLPHFVDATIHTLGKKMKKITIDTCKCVVCLETAIGTHVDQEVDGKKCVSFVCANCDIVNFEAASSDQKTAYLAGQDIVVPYAC
jgi:hypothetical protein